jgi:hypothetical protein
MADQEQLRHRYEDRGTEGEAERESGRRHDLAGRILRRDLMDKTSIKNFATWARKKLMQDVADKAALVGVTANGIRNPESSSTQDVQFFDVGMKAPYSIRREEIDQRRGLVTAILKKEEGSDYKTAFNSVVEEVAYTWFNRLVAIRFMEVNGFMPSSMRVLSGEDGRTEPDIVARPFDSGLAFSDDERNKIISMKEDNKQDDLFSFLFIRQCNFLNGILPGLFEKTNDYTELLLNISFTGKEGVVPRLISDVSEDDFKEAVEIVGWMYQYYNTEPKDETFALLQKNVKVTKERIPAATQLFTPDWIVRYMVENSLGRLWLEGHPNDELKGRWKYYLDEAEQTQEVQEQLKAVRAERAGLTPEDITFIDPCMGSGHILVYAFEVLMQIYESAGYTKTDSARLILEKNLYGLDIDKRAHQLAYFALMMCARKYDKRFFEAKASPQVYHPEGYRDGENYGSLLKIDESILGARPQEQRGSITSYSEHEAELRIWNFKRLLSKKYDVVCTNPPYMGSSGMNPLLSSYVKTSYPDSKSDLFAVFIERCGQLLKSSGYQAMITQHAWMFLSSYERLRDKLLARDIINMAHLGARAFEEIDGEVVQTTAFVMSVKKTVNFMGTYMRLVDYGSQSEKEAAFLTGGDHYTANANDFAKIPGSPVAYWANPISLEFFESAKSMKEIANPRLGFATGDNDQFMRLWFEVVRLNIGFGFTNREAARNSHLKWFPTNKGGESRRWYGNLELVVNWEDDGYEIRNFKDETGYLRSRPQNLNDCFRQGLSWTVISNMGSFRFSPLGHLYNNKGPIMSSKENQYDFYVLGLLNSVVSQYYLMFLSPTLGFEAGYISRIPVLLSDNQNLIEDTVVQNIALSRADWDVFETSWDFKAHPLIVYALLKPQLITNEQSHGIQIENTLEDAFREWEHVAAERFDALKANEEELNRIFIDIYGLADELTPEVEDKDVTVRRADLGREIRSLISYAIGCMFGRYSLDVEGLAYAGGQWDSSKYQKFIPDDDDIIPITDEEYFKDDIVARFIEFVRIVYGGDSLEENLDFIAKALGIRGNTSREIIRNYFLKEFYKDHLKVYQKRPIYWLFDSGKENGFKALVYLHRYNQDTIGKLRIDYLHKIQAIYDSEIARMRRVETSTDAKEVSDARKRREKLIKQLAETKEYDAKIGHLATARISLDLDDGVKVNYEKLQTGQDRKKYEVLGKI